MGRFVVGLTNGLLVSAAIWLGMLDAALAAHHVEARLIHVIHRHLL